MQILKGYDIVPAEDFPICKNDSAIEKYHQGSSDREED